MKIVKIWSKFGPKMTPKYPDFRPKNGHFLTPPRASFFYKILLIEKTSKKCKKTETDDPFFKKYFYFCPNYLGSIFGLSALSAMACQFQRDFDRPHIGFAFSCTDSPIT